MSEPKRLEVRDHVEATFGPAGGSLPAMPLRVIVLSELTPRDLRTGESVEQRVRRRIDRQSFDETMAALGMRVVLDVVDRLTSGSEPLLLELKLDGIGSFGPDAVATQIPATRELLELRDALLRHSSGQLSWDALQKKLEATGGSTEITRSVRRILKGAEAAPPAAVAARPSSSTGESGSVEAILDLVSKPSEQPSGDGRGADLARLEGLVHQLVSAGRKEARADSRATEAAVAEIDAALSRQVDEVLHHGEFLRLESAWRGLKFLVDRSDFREPIKLEIVPASKERLLQVYDEVVHVPESAQVTSEPLGLVVVDHAFGLSQEDSELLRGLSERGAALSVPVIASASPDLLGLYRARDLEAKPGLAGHFDGAALAKWNGLRSYGPSRWLGLAFNRVLLRAPFGPDGPGARTFAYREALGARGDAALPWGNASWAVAALAARSFARTGWCTDMMGQRASGMIENLPLRSYPRSGRLDDVYPLETVVSDVIERDLTGAGLMALTGAMGSDRSYLRYAAMVHLPRSYGNPSDKARARLQATLPFQFFVGRLLNYAMLVEPVIVPGREPGAVCVEFERALRGIMSTAGPVPPDAVQVSVHPNESDASRRDLCLKVRWPGFQSLPEAGEVELRWPIA